VENILISLLGTHFKNSKGLSSDKYQSVSLNQKMLDIGIKGSEAVFPSNPLQVRRGKIYRHLVWNNLAEYLDDPVRKKEMGELLMLNNSKLDHPDGGSKDIFDADSNCVSQIIESGGRMNALDIQGIIPNDGDTMMEKKKMDLYRIGIKRFSRKYGRMYDTAEEFCVFMRETGYKFTELDVINCEIEIENIRI
jgi:hypothetical protein